MTDIHVPFTRARISEANECSCVCNMSNTAIEENTFEAITTNMVSHKTSFSNRVDKPLKSSFIIRVCVAKVTSIVTTGIKKLEGGLSVH